MSVTYTERREEKAYVQQQYYRYKKKLLQPSAVGFCRTRLLLLAPAHQPPSKESSADDKIHYPDHHNGQPGDHKGLIVTPMRLEHCMVIIADKPDIEPR